tara:strand:- start:201 stop:1373 length:1173 start_codon:yes stop_codon:yes gene_type:complete
MKNKCLQWKSGMYISTEGNVRLCCVSQEKNNNSEIHIDNIENLQSYFNSQYYIDLRNKNFRNIDMCNSCKTREIIEQKSLRHMCKNTFDMYEIDYNRNNDDCLIEFLDLSFNNLCNQQCVMCSSEWSSKWYKYDKEYENTQFIRKPTQYLKWTNKKNIDKIKRLLPHLKLLSIKGGEPLIQEEVKDILLYIKNRDLDCYVNIVSNFQKASKEILEIICSMRNMVLTISIDSTGKRYEWIRGGKWKNTLSNIKTYVHNCKFYPSFGYANTLNRWSVEHLVEDIKIMEEFNSKITKDVDNANSWYNILIATGPAYVSPLVLPREKRLDIIYEFEKNFGIITDESIQYKSLTLNHLKTITSLENEQDNITDDTINVSNDWEGVINNIRKYRID